MKSVRRLLPAITVMVAVLATATAPAFAALQHPVCVAKHHDCGNGPALTTCCCGDEQASQTDSTPGLSRVDLRVDLSSMPVVMDAAPVPASAVETFAIGSSPPHRATLDLSTLFSALLI